MFPTYPINSESESSLHHVNLGRNNGPSVSYFMCLARIATSKHLLLDCRNPFICTGRPHIVSLLRHCLSNKVNVCGNPALSKCLWTPYFQQHLLILCQFHILAILLIFQTLIYCACHGGFWSGVFDVTSVIVSGSHKLHPYRAVNFVDKRCVCSTCSTNWLLPCRFPFSETALFPETQESWN